MRYEVNELGEKIIKNLLDKVMYNDNGKFYCKYCGKELKYTCESHNYNHGYHTRTVCKYECDCNKFENIIVGDTD